jgi:hypothetical protein
MNVVIPEIGMTSLSGLMSVRLSHQEAPAQQPAGSIRLVKRSTASSQPPSRKRKRYGCKPNKIRPRDRPSAPHPA